MEAYSDAFAETFTPAVASSHPETSEHYPRQREAFYSAEALRLFARDHVPAGTFECLQSEIHDGVVDVCLTACPDGLTRLERVTAAATSLQLVSNALVSVLFVRDRKGVVHQLANEDRLVWVRS